MAENTEIKLFDSKGKEVGTKAVPTSIFGTSVPLSLLHQVVRWQRAKKRAGTHKTKTRAEVSGGGRKPWRQKGLGKARAGSNTSSIWVGGGIAHGPKPRSYEFQMNKKERKKALCGAISLRTTEGRCLALTEFGIKEPKTKPASELLQKIGALPKKTVLVLGSDDQTSLLSTRNIEGVTPLESKGLNVYDVLNAEFLVFTEDGLQELQARLVGAQGTAE